MTWLQFIVSKVFFKHVALALGIIVILLLITYYSLGLYTNHGESYATPNFIGMNLKQVDSICKVERFRWHVVDSVYLPNKPKGSIIAQNPIPGFKVKANRTIFFTMNAILPLQIPVPELQDVSLRQVASILETYGLKVGKIEFVPDITNNVVLRMKYQGKIIHAGYRVFKGAAIDLVVSSGRNNDKTYIPVLIGLTVSDAEDQLLMASLSLGAVVYDATVKTSQDSSNAVIWKQQPMYTKKLIVASGSLVDVWLTLDNNKVPAIDSTLLKVDEPSLTQHDETDFEN